MATVGMATVGMAKVGMAKVCMAKVGMAKVGMAKVCTAKVYNAASWRKWAWQNCAWEKRGIINAAENCHTVHCKTGCYINDRRLGLVYVHAHRFNAKMLSLTQRFLAVLSSTQRF
jgi:hypothetical protein